MGSTIDASIAWSHSLFSALSDIRHHHAHSRRLIAPVWQRIQRAYDRLTALSEGAKQRAQAAQRNQRSNRAAHRRSLRRARRARRQAQRDQLQTMALTTEEEHPQATKRQQRDQHFSHRRLVRKSRRARRQAPRAVAAAQFELELRSMALCVTDTCDAALSTFANQHRKRRNRSSNGSSKAGLGPTVRLSRRLVTGVRWSRRAALILPPMVRAAFPQACLLVANTNNCGSSARSRCKGLHRAMERLSQHLPQTFASTDLRPARAKRVPRRMWSVVPDNGITTNPEETSTRPLEHDGTQHKIQHVRFQTVKRPNVVAQQPVNHFNIEISIECK